MINSPKNLLAESQSLTIAKIQEESGLIEQIESMPEILKFGLSKVGRISLRHSPKDNTLKTEESKEHY